MDIKAIMEKMSLEEKMKFLTGADNWNTVEFEELGIPAVTVSDGPHGLRKVYFTETGERKQYEAVCFSTGSATAATWNTEKIREVGQALAEECIEHDVDILLGPGVNMKRSSLCGRNFEYFSEDPYLAGKLGAAYIDGLQNRGIGASLKHFAGNSQEYDRFFSSSEMDERTMREIYLKAFEIAVKESKPWTVMCAYNRLNGVHCSQNPVLLDEILRKEWGYEGVVMSDWGAVHDRPAALKASLELEMPYSEISLPALKEAYEKGEITESEINRAVKSLLNLVQKVEIEKPKRKLPAKTTEERLHLAKEVAAEAITMLKNEDEILPISPKKFKKIAVIGSCAENPFIQGGGSSRLAPVMVEKPLEEIHKNTEYEITYSPGYYWSHVNTCIEMFQYKEALDTAAAADMVLLFVGENYYVEKEGTDRTTMRLDYGMEQLIVDTAKVNPNTVVIIQAGSAIEMSPWINRVKGVVFSWYIGSCGASALADILFGRINPSGKLAETFPVSLADTPTYGKFPASPSAWYQEGIMMGYRYYDIEEKDVLFPFGYGLSYTDFSYSDLTFSSDRLEEGKKLNVSLKVKNIGNMEGKEVIQIYVRDVISTVRRPLKELKGFQKVLLQPGEEKLMEFTLEWNDFAFYSSVYHKWMVEEGAFEIMIGASSRDIRLCGKIMF
jgi:beta-glucosidase